MIAFAIVTSLRAIAIMTSLCGLCCAAGHTGHRVPDNAGTLHPQATKTASNPDRRLDRPTKANLRKSSLNSKSHCLKVVETFRCVVERGGRLRRNSRFLRMLCRNLTGRFPPNTKNQFSVARRCYAVLSAWPRTWRVWWAGEKPCPSKPYPPFVPRAPWNKGRIVGQKRPLLPKHVWSIRIRLEMADNRRDLALFNMAIDCKRRGCDLVCLRVDDVFAAGHVKERASVT